MNRYQGPIVVVLVMALALAGAVVWLPGARAQEEAPEPRAPLAAVANTFTYQGRLEQDGAPVNGTCDFQFRLWDAAEGGNPIGASDDWQLPVEDGRFTVTLNEHGDFGAAPFDGEARWLAIAVRCPAGSGEYEPLAPRQPLTAAPYALSLRPGTVISGTVDDGGAVVLNNPGSGGDGLVVESAAEIGVLVEYAGGAGMFVDRAVVDGIFVDEVGAAGLAINTAGTDGLRVASAGHYGLRVLSAGDDGVRIQAAGDNGLYVGGAGGNGVFVVTAGSPSATNPTGLNNGLAVLGAEGNGVFVGRADNHGFRVFSAANEGVLVDGAGGNGIAVGTAGADGLRVISAGDEGVQVDAAVQNGLFVSTAGANGVYVGSADAYGFRVFSAGLDGVRVDQADGDGVFANTTNVAGEWGFSTPDKINASNVTASSMTLVARVGGDGALAPGDVVSAVGVAEPLAEGGRPLAVVVAAGGDGMGIAGVVEGRMVLAATLDGAADGPVVGGGEQWSLRSVPGPAGPGDYVALTIAGVARVRVAPGAAVAPGERLTAGDGAARPLATVTVDGVELAEGAAVVGVALSEPDAEGFVWVLVNPE